MKRVIILTLFILSNVLILHSRDVGKVRNYVHLCRSNGVICNTIVSVSEDVNQRVWIGTLDGLNIYNSSSVSTVERYRGSNINKLCNIDSEMLIATSMSVDSYNYQSGLFSTLANIAINGEAICTYNDGVYIVSADKLYSYSSGRSELLLLAEGVPSVSRICVDKYGNLWGVEDDTVYRFGSDYSIERSYQLEVPRNTHIQAISLFADSRGVVWVGTINDKLFRYNSSNDSFLQQNSSGEYKSHSIDNICSINEDEYGRLIIGHNNGFALYDYINDDYTEYKICDSENFMVNTTVTCIHNTQSGGIILGTYFTGAYDVRNMNTKVNFTPLCDHGDKVHAVAANGIIEFSDDELWVGTNCMGIAVCDNHGRIKRHMNLSNSPIHDNIVSLEIDRHKNVWAGSLSNGLFRITPQREILHYNNSADNASISGMSIMAIKTLDSDKVLISTDRGLDIYSYASDKFTRIFENMQQSNYCNNILVDGHRVLIVNTNNILEYNIATHQETINDFSDCEPITCGHIDKSGTVWIGNNNSELLIFEDGKLTPQAVAGLRSDGRIFGLQSDARNNLWFALGNKVCCFSAERSVKSYNVGWGLGDHEFNIRSSYVDNHGLIYFGYTNGLVSFDPSNMEGQNIDPPKIYISEMRVLNSIVDSSSTDSPLEAHVDRANCVVLRNKERVVSFAVDCINFNHDDYDSYKLQYRLLGLNNIWVDVNDPSHEISFSNLQTGHYQLQIRIVDHMGDVISQRSLEIQVRPPVALTWYMLLLYLLVISLIAWPIVRSMLKARVSRQLIADMKQEQLNVDRQNVTRLELFTYIAQEFRYPLSIIETLQDRLIDQNNSSNDEVEIFRDNIRRLTSLVDQLVDYRNIESNLKAITLANGDIVASLHNTYMAFLPAFKYQNTSCRFESSLDSHNVTTDFDKIEMLVGYLLNDILGLAASGGENKMILKIDKEAILIGIVVQNDGLTKSQIDSLIEPYCQLASNTYSNNNIGLSIVRNVSYMLHADISIESIGEDGYTLRVMIPIAAAHPMEIKSKASGANAVVGRIVGDNIYLAKQAELLQEKQQGGYQYKILFVGAASVTKIINKYLRESFQVVVASKHSEAIGLLKSQSADVIINDISLVEEQGIALCQAVKTDERLRQTPIIVLNSNNDISLKIKSFESGADAYMLKPVSIQELLLRLNNILSNKKSLRDYYLNMPSVTSANNISSSSEERFAEDITRYIIDHMEGQSISVEELSSHFHMSRTQLYLKIKQLSNKTPSAFILQIKMDEAKRLVATTEKTIAEIADALGYCNASHFNKQFKNYWDQTPTAMRSSSYSKLLKP